MTWGSLGFEGDGKGELGFGIGTACGKGSGMGLARTTSKKSVDEQKQSVGSSGVQSRSGNGWVRSPGQIRDSC